MKEKEVTIFNPDYAALKPEEEGKTWWKLEDVMLCMQPNAYKCFNIGPSPKKESND